MKAKIDFGYMKKEERDDIIAFLGVFFSSKISFLNVRKKYNPESLKMIFNFDGQYFAIVFEDKISLDDEINVCKSVIKLNQQGVNIKRVFDFQNSFPIFQEEFLYNDKRLSFATTSKFEVLSREMLDDGKEVKEIILTKQVAIKIKNYSKVSNNIYKLFPSNDIVFNIGCLEKNIFCNFLKANNKIILTIDDIRGGDFMDNQKESTNIKGELFIGTIDLSLDSLLSMKRGDKIILDKDEKIDAVLRIEGKDCLKGVLEFGDNEDKNIIFHCTSSL